MSSPRLENDKKLVAGAQRRAIKIIPGLKDLTYEQRLEKMKLPSMCYRRLRDDFIDLFKYTHNIYKLSDSLLELETRTNILQTKETEVQHNTQATLLHTENRGQME